MHLAFARPRFTLADFAPNRLDPWMRGDGTEGPANAGRVFDAVKHRRDTIAEAVTSGRQVLAHREDAARALQVLASA